jgi:hypothetical protein
MPRHTNGLNLLSYVGFYVICLALTLAEQSSARNVRREMKSLETSRDIRAIALKASLTDSRHQIGSDHMIRTLLFESWLKTESFEVALDPANDKVLWITSGWPTHGLRFELLKLVKIIAGFGWFALLLVVISRARARRRRNFSS